MKAHPDRPREVVDAVIEALDDGLDGRALAARAMLSPFHFNRLVRAGIGEAPAAFRRSSPRWSGVSATATSGTMPSSTRSARRQSASPSAV